MSSAAKKLLVAAALVANLAAGCKGKTVDKDRRTAKGDWSAKCAAAMTELDGIAPPERPGHLIAACAPCDVATIAAARFDGSHAATWLDDLDKAITGCGGYCTPSARKDFLLHAKHQLDVGEHSAKPWRKLGEACPAQLGVRPETRAYVGGAWFALHRIAGGLARLPGMSNPAASTRAAFPLPALPPEGFGLDLPPPDARATVPQPGAIAVTILADKEMSARLPWASIADGKVAVAGAFPGEDVTDYPALSALVDADHSAMLLAPRQLSALRVALVLQRLGKPAQLAVAGPLRLPDYAPPMILPVILTTTPAPGAVNVQVTSADVALPAAPYALAVDERVTVETLAVVLARVQQREVAIVTVEASPPAPAK